MNQTSATNIDTSAINHPVKLIEAFSRSQASGCLQVSHNSITYSIYLHEGKLIYATCSVALFERLERQLRRLSNRVATLKTEVRTQARLKFESETSNLSDYRAICWLLKEQYIQSEDVKLLLKRMIEEVFELYLLTPENYQHQFQSNVSKLPIFCIFEIPNLISHCQQNLKAWQSYTDKITSLDQRPYFFGNSNVSEKVQKLGQILKGFSFRQLAAIYDQDEIKLAKKIYPLIVNKTIVLRDPQSPYDLLPKLSEFKATVHAPEAAATTEELDDSGLNISKIISVNADAKKEWKIVCIDDSQTILNEMKRFLEDEKVSLVLINDPLKALMKIIRIRPDIILMDVGMPNIDGYKLCSLIRKYSAFKDTPIVMVTGNKSLIDRAKAKIAGATDYLTKPFTQEDLLNMIFRYIN